GSSEGGRAEAARRAAPPEDGARGRAARADAGSISRRIRRAPGVRGGSAPRAVVAREGRGEQARVRGTPASALAGGDVRVPSRVARGAPARRRPPGGPRGARA